MAEAVNLAHLPQDLTLYITCFKDVHNAPYLRQQLLAGNQAFNYAFIDATTILSRRHLLTACFRALNDHVHDRLRSNNVQSEVVFCLSSNNNIGDAFRRFGIQDESQHLIVVKVKDEAGEVTQQSVEEHVTGAVEGTTVSFTDDWLLDICDLNKVRKAYKIAASQQPSKGGAKVNGDSGSGRDERSKVEVQVLGFMALRGAA